MRKRQTQFQLDESDIKILNKKARRTKRSKSSLVRELIRERGFSKEPFTREDAEILLKRIIQEAIAPLLREKAKEEAAAKK
jgi:hypothetical protein